MIHKLIFVLGLVLLSVTYSACRKNNENKTVGIEGSVITKGVNTAAEGVSVKVKYQQIGGGVYSSAYKTAASTVTDANGRYSLSFEKPSTAEFVIELSSPRHFAQENREAAEHFEGGTKTRHYILNAVGIVSVNIVNHTPFDENDKLIFQLENEASSCDDCCNSQPTSYTGDVVNVIRTCQRTGATYARLKWFVTRNATTETFSDSVYVVPFDTTFYQLRY